MMENLNMNMDKDKARMMTDKERLIGALIGLARATDGNTVRTKETGRLIREGLLALNGKDCEELIYKIHAEKRILAPDCATCGAPCGKTADYDINLWKKEEDPVREQKWLLLDRLTQLAATDKSSAYASDIDYFLTKSLFALGESWEEEWIAALVKEADGTETIV